MVTVRRNRKESSHLRLVESSEGLNFSHPLTDATVRMEFEKLTEKLMDVCIEMMDVVDGDPDLESPEEDLEESDGA